MIIVPLDILQDTVVVAVITIVRAVTKMIDMIEEDRKGIVPDLGLEIVMMRSDVSLPPEENIVAMTIRPRLLPCLLSLLLLIIVPLLLPCIRHQLRLRLLTFTRPTQMYPVLVVLVRAFSLLSNWTNVALGLWSLLQLAQFPSSKRTFTKSIQMCLVVLKIKLWPFVVSTK